MLFSVADPDLELREGGGEALFYCWLFFLLFFLLFLPKIPNKITNFHVQLMADTIIISFQSPSLYPPVFPLNLFYCSFSPDILNSQFLARQFFHINESDTIH